MDERGDAIVGAAQVAAFLGVSEKTVRNWTSLGMLPAYRINTRCTRYSLGEVSSWLETFHQRGRGTRWLPLNSDGVTNTVRSNGETDNGNRDDMRKRGY